MSPVLVGLLLTGVTVLVLQHARELLMIIMAVMLALMFIGLATVVAAVQQPMV